MAALFLLLPFLLPLLLPRQPQDFCAESLGYAVELRGAQGVGKAVPFALFFVLRCVLRPADVAFVDQSFTVLASVAQWPTRLPLDGTEKPQSRALSVGEPFV